MSPALALLVRALIIVESGGNPAAVGDNGNAVGVLQITPAVIEDVNRIQTAQKFTPADRLNVEKSILIFCLYCDYYATDARIGREVTVEDVARIWVGGPRGWKKRSTLNYWRKVERELRRARQ